MKEYFFYIFLIFSIFIANFFLKKNNLLTNYTGQNHQLYTVKEKVPLSGGLFLMIYFLFQHYSFDKYLIIFLMFFFIIGLMADLNIIQSPLKRFLIQSIVIFFFIITMDLYIADIRIDFINNLLQIKFFNILFIFLCLSVLLNGTNFIDGNNGIVLGYYSIVLASIIIFILNNSIDYEFKMLISFLYFMIVLLFFNIF
jgi:UDP-N-acetylmuramyl pentapeptide phosphotransferase/UDP-N-acetylglucosamine-1-phosphate transferase